jgi:hypothetical protein
MENTYTINNLFDLLKIVIPSFITLLAGYLGYKYGINQIMNQKRLEFIERQLREFYSPMIGHRKIVEANIKLINDIFKSADIEWKKLCEKNTNPSEKERVSFDNIIKYNNKQLHEEIIPFYEKMISTFKENYYLAEPETRDYFDELFRFVDIWHRSFENSIPSSVIIELNQTENKLKPFYNDLEKQLEKLRKKLSLKK